MGVYSCKALLNAPLHISPPLPLPHMQRCLTNHYYADSLVVRIHRIKFIKH